MKTIAKTTVNGLTVSTVQLATSPKVRDRYETIVLDACGDELRVVRAHYLNDAKSNHYLAVVRFANKRNCLHILH